MHISILHAAPIPAHKYGGTERVIWDLGKGLVSRGHRVTYLVPSGSHCDFAPIVPLDLSRPLATQVPANTDVLHSQITITEPVPMPCLVTEHGNPTSPIAAHQNTVFVSKNHAHRHGSTHFVHNGLDWSAYGPVNWGVQREGFHFLGKAAWRLKNVKGAIDVALRAGQPLDVLGGSRIQFKRGLRFTFSRQIRFHGMVGGEEKLQLLNRSNGLIFPVRWHEPFGLAVIESLYFGCPVFATPYGALPELVPDGMGLLTANAEEMAHGIRTMQFERDMLHAHAVTQFNAERMVSGYLRCYEQLLDGEHLTLSRTPVPARQGGLAWLG